MNLITPIHPMITIENLDIKCWSVKETLLIKLAWLLPHRLVYWCAIRVFVHATQGRYANESVGDRTVQDALNCWNQARYPINPTACEAPTPKTQ